MIPRRRGLHRRAMRAAAWVAVIAMPLTAGCQRSSVQTKESSTSTPTQAPTPPPPPSSVPDRSPPDDALTGAMVRIPAGTITLGNRRRQVEIPAFEIDRTEVTQAAYAVCMKAGACTEPDVSQTLCRNVSMQTPRPTWPARCIDHTQADAFCRWAQKRLPTEDEWEYAARGTDGRHYVWGNDFATPDDACWGRSGPCAVDSHARDRSPFGVMDMAASVTEWTSSCPDARPCSEAAPLRVVRGANFLRGSAVDLDVSTSRSVRRTGDDYYLIGIRCAR